MDLKREAIVFLSSKTEREGNMEMIRVSKSTIDSLVCFYFGITLDGKNEKENNIIRRLAERAFIDATNQGAFNTKANKVP